MTTPPPPAGQWPDQYAPGPAQPYSLGNLMPSPTPPAQPAPRANRPGAWTVLGAGVAVVLGSFLPWASITVPIGGTVTVSGVDGSDGWITAVVGALLAVYGFVTLRRPLAIAVDTVAALGGLGIAGLGAWKVADLQSRITDLKAEMVADGDELGIAARMAEAVHARVGFGLWLLIAGGLVAAVAIGYAILKRR